ncbi:MAG: 23S rRNA (guanosine(2251)-2'-O)-methyltransferase RlmB [Oceanospirillales bacterium]|uniref:23S rRNA (guanosine-2'-O-)-methyltransferase RlmB n=1 Tax=Marinobacterium halophilum TaxID=267374 RepID=A0A2P8F1E5_9GAMM|nr:23S rRNA (guanosine(2251)-2'-O)-methyltransferase RlmB [Marinobacterium halophilum]MBR9829391.1 23S rRNA (guanosine(2251)-2'-O)-methyltransferase RlmB [Oceanospirillales bacterium]PSL15540.1 23S rRNA Gm-2251 2'-O-methyltransferase [Marinobacterium halophilum]
MSQTDIFGLHAVTSLLNRNPGRVRRLWVQQGRRDERVQTLLDTAETLNIKVVEEPKAQLDLRTGGGRHQGVIAECEPIKALSEKALDTLLDYAGEAPLLLILDGVTDPHNLGACLRTADAAGVTLVIAPKDKSAPLNATVAKVACGAAEVVPYIQVTNLARTLQLLQQRGIWITGTAGEAEASVYQTDLTGPCALVMGAEGKGMRRLTRENCDQLINIPMAGEVSSLNVSVATGVCLFEAVRQRAAAQS